LALGAIHWRDATRIDAAVQKLATNAHGDLVRIKDHPTAAKLHVGSYVVYLNFDPFEGVLLVWFIFRT
jgi:mRNA-degrading endonuclease RelE of RelBE toxin-antitoxin system